MTRTNRLAACLALMAPMTIAAAEEPGGFLSASDFGAHADRGRISLGFQFVNSDGFLDGSGNTLPGASTEAQSLTLAVDYALTDRWMLHASIPFVRKRSRNDPGMHNPDRLVEPHPDSRFLDDGAYHGAWQDWQFGVGYRTHVLGFDLRPHAIVTWPSHDYTFFASAAVGQRLKRLRIGADASRRLGQTNFHYSFGYSYELVEEVMDVHLDKHHFRLSGRYDFSPQFSATLFANDRRGHGKQPSDFFGRPQTTEAWYQHDRLLRHNYTFAGLGGTWRFDDKWSASASAARLIRGDSMHRVRHAYDVQIARGF